MGNLNGSFAELKGLQHNSGLIDFLLENSIVNYFMIQGLEREKYKKVFNKKWVEFDEKGNFKTVLLKRKTGNMQIYGKGDYNLDGIIELLNKEGFKKLIGEEKVVGKLIENYNFSKVEKGSIISELDNIYRSIDRSYEGIKRVNIEDLGRIIKLYKKTFSGFTPKELMYERYLNNKARGYYIEEDGKIVSVAQSAYEQEGSGVIIGVATDPIYRKQGLATKCLIALCEELLIREGKKLYLQYDNPKAGKIYRELGFVKVGRMINCFGGV